MKSQFFKKLEALAIELDYIFGKLPYQRGEKPIREWGFVSKVNLAESIT